MSASIGSVDSGESAILDTNGNDVTFATALTGDGGLVKIGDGTLTLSVANSYLGATVVGGGTLSFDNETVSR